MFNFGKRKMIGKYVIIRADRAGVFVGILAAKHGSEVTVKNVRRIWYWEGAASLSQMAVEGVKNEKECNFSMTVESITILGVCEILPCTDAARANIEGVHVWKV